MKRAAVCVFLVVALAGCGQTGALYFDEAPPADQLPPSRKAPPVSVAQPVVEEKDKGEAGP